MGKTREITMVEKTHSGDWISGLANPLKSIGQRVADWFAPRSDASAMAGNYEINMELPGVEPDNIDVSVHDHTLHVRGEKHYEHKEKGRSYFFSEREYGAFQRSFRLPPDADADKIEADFRNGVLCLKIPKHRPEKAAGKRIRVKSGS